MLTIGSEQNKGRQLLIWIFDEADIEKMRQGRPVVIPINKLLPGVTLPLFVEVAICAEESQGIAKLKEQVQATAENNMAPLLAYLFRGTEEVKAKEA